MTGTQSASMSGRRRFGRKAASYLQIALRLLLGAMLINTGWGWFSRPDGAGYLADAIALALEGDRTFRFYRPFITGVVVPNVGLFATLVGLGELVSGLSLTLGAATLVGAVVITFNFINYGLLGGPMGLVSHGVMILLVWTAVVFRSGRRFGLDRWLHRRWPGVRIW